MTLDLAAVQKAQEDYFSEAVATSDDGDVTQRSVYQAMPRTAGEGWWTTCYEGALGAGWILWEEQTMGNGTLQWRCTDYGPEGRTQAWKPLRATDAAIVRAQKDKL